MLDSPGISMDVPALRDFSLERLIRGVAFLGVCDTLALGHLSLLIASTIIDNDLIAIIDL
jgi:hypothetical protein